MQGMGLNAIASYFFWNDFEHPDGSFDFKSGNRDVAAFLQLCKEEGMWVLFRPGPYCCGEWDFGGLPPRLLKDDIVIRSSDPRFLAEAEKYLAAIADIAEPFLAKNGGPVILTQIENEYGSWPFKDVNYLKWVKAFWKKRGFGPFYMSDGAGDSFLKDLIYPDPEIAVGFDPAMNEEQWSFAGKYNPGVPVMSSETYPGWLRHWGESPWRPSDLSETIRWYMQTGKSFNIFVAHGGTSFGFTAGANDGNGGFEPDLTSYDYGSPIGERGNYTAEYAKYRSIIGEALHEEIPDVPPEIPSCGFAPVMPKKLSGLKSCFGSPVTAAKPLVFEALGQNQGIVMYRTSIPAGKAAELNCKRIADYAQVYLDGKRIATVDRRFGFTPIAIPARKNTATLEILVEAMGHINFGKGMVDDRKGLIGPVTLDAIELKDWAMYPMPLDFKSVCDAGKDAGNDGLAGGHFRGEFVMDTVADTFIDMSKWTKGTVYVNGHNLGRYWNTGPQHSLYCPAPFLQSGTNVIDIVELELSEPQQIAGLPESKYAQSKENTVNAANVW